MNTKTLTELQKRLVESYRQLVALEADALAHGAYDFWSKNMQRRIQSMATLRPEDRLIVEAALESDQATKH
jgi:hypothetical protein